MTRAQHRSHTRRVATAAGLTVAALVLLACAAFAGVALTLWLAGLIGGGGA